jgi:hypothetical protein
MNSDDRFQVLLRAIPPVELLRVVPMPEAERLSGLSADTLRRRHREKIKDLSERRQGMRVIDALMLREESTTDAA